MPNFESVVYFLLVGDHPLVGGDHPRVGGGNLSDYLFSQLLIHVEC